MRINFFFVDDGFIKAGFSAAGKKYIRPVLQQGSFYHVNTGSRNNRKRYGFSSTQEQALESFVNNEIKAEYFTVPIV